VSIDYEHPAGSLEPPLQLELRQPATIREPGSRREDDGTWTKPIPLTAAVSVTARLFEITATPALDTTVDFSRDLVFIDRQQGQCNLVWQSGDDTTGPVSVPRSWRLTVRINWPGDRPQDVPQRREDAFTIRVV
jgi:hypothetical protein